MKGSLSLRARLIVAIVALMTCGLAVADVVGVVLLRSYLLQRLDQQLAFPLDRSVRAERDRPDPCTASPGADDTSTQQLPTHLVLTIFGADGTLRCQLPRQLAEAEHPELSRLDPDRLAAAASSSTVLTLPGQGGAADWRARVVRFDDGYLATAISTADVQATVRRLAVVTSATSLVILALAATGGLVLVRIGLRPLTAIEHTAEAIARGDISRRIDEAPANTEVGRLTSALNTMLARIEQALTARSDSEDRLRQFVADASHELRTPIATIRGHAELYRQGAASEADTALLLGRIESEAIRMGALVEDMLLLARMDSAPQLAAEEVDLLTTAAAVVVDARVRDPDRSIVLRSCTRSRWEDVPPVVRGDSARLHQVLANLLSNALRHTPAGCPVEVEVGVRDGQVRCRVIDHGPGLAPELTAKVFERFYRGDASRTRKTGGAGLGLAIVSSLVTAHGGRVWYEPTPGGGGTFVVSLDPDRLG